MKRLIAVVLLSLLSVFSITAQAQSRGMHGGFARPTAAPSVRPHVSAPVITTPSFRFSPAVPVAGSPHFAHPYRSAEHQRIRTFGYYAPILPVLPYYGTPFYGTPFYGTSFSATPYYEQPAYSAPAAVMPEQAPASQNETELAYEVGRLSAEVEQLRMQQASRQPSPAPPVPNSAPQAAHSATPTVLVFKDGHRLEVENYAIAGQTLWVLDEHLLTRYSLSELDLDATRKENQERGIRFRIPGQ